MDSSSRISLTQTVGRQTPRNEFGSVLKSTLEEGLSMGGTLLGAVPGGAMISAAVSSLTSPGASSGRTATATATASAVAGISTLGNRPLGGATGSALAGSPLMAPPELTGMIGQMRAEADRATMMQMQMQQESREYNTISNVLKVRHDSAKSAINNIR